MPIAELLTDGCDDAPLYELHAAVDRCVDASADHVAASCAAAVVVAATAADEDDDAVDGETGHRMTTMTSATCESAADAGHELRAD